MKNLENFGVQELNSKEASSLNGGWIDRVIWGVGALVLAVLNTDWDEAAADFNRGFADGH